MKVKFEPLPVVFRAMTITLETEAEYHAVAGALAQYRKMPNGVGIQENKRLAGQIEDLMYIERFGETPR